MQVDAWACKNFLEQMIESIVDDSHSGMSGVSFHTDLPIGGLLVYVDVVIVNAVRIV